MYDCGMRFVLWHRLYVQCRSCGDCRSCTEEYKYTQGQQDLWQAEALGLNNSLTSFDVGTKEVPDTQEADCTQRGRGITQFSDVGCWVISKSGRAGKAEVSTSCGGLGGFTLGSPGVQFSPGTPTV